MAFAHCGPASPCFATNLAHPSRGGHPILAGHEPVRTEVAMASRAVVLIALLVAACSSGSAPGSTSAPPSLRLPASSAAGPAASDESTAGTVAALRPSGAKIRVVNLYSGGSATPTPIDVYGN